jgi:nicotinate-nucleotide adenylyltransferase
VTSAKKIGLYFGTFNPIHVGHLTIANYMAEYSDLDEIWMVVTPHNPHKKKSSLLSNTHRLTMVRIALEDYSKIKASNVEFDLPQPNYTVHTLVHLEEHYSEHQFCLIMGEDNLNSLHKWKNYEVILERYAIYVYPRITNTSATAVKKTKVALVTKDHPKVTMVNAPIMELSSTFIRNAIKEGKNIRPMLPQHVWEYIDEMSFYK